MRVTASATLIILSYISAQVMGLVLRPKDSVEAKEPLNLRDLARDYITELMAQNQAIEQVENQLSLGSEGSSAAGPIEISELCNSLLESYYRQTEPRNRMVEITPTDSVLDSASIEYLVAVASRYATNVMHLARKLRRDPIDQETVFEDVNSLRKEHSKTQMFDQILLELANVSLIPEITEPPTEDLNISTSTSSEQTSAPEEKGAEKGVQPKAKKEGEDEVEMIVKVEQEIHTTTTETVLKSYTETSANW